MSWSTAGSVLRKARYSLPFSTDGRYMSVQEIEEIAEGRVWTGEMAKKIGLVDELGGLQDAVKGEGDVYGDNSVE